MALVVAYRYIPLQVSMTLLFEWLKSTAEHEIPREMRPVLQQILAEFTCVAGV